MFKDSRQRAVSTDTLIGQGTHAEGNLICEAGIRIEGEYSGDIACKGDVVIGECGVAKATITAQDLTIAGVVYGDVKTLGRLTITATGQLHGTMDAQTLIIQEGGILSGQCKMEKPQQAISRTQPAGSPTAKEDRSKDPKDAKEMKSARQAG